MSGSRKTISHHAAVAIVESEVSGQRLFLFNKYDENYPRPFFRGALTLIGGTVNFEKDKSPYQNVTREIREEFSGEFEELKTESLLVKILGERHAPQKKPVLAPMEEISQVKNNILTNLVPYKDFLVVVPPLDGKPGVDWISSTYISKVPKNIFALVKDNLNAGRSMINEGYIQIVSEQEIISGDLPFAWGTGTAIGDYLNCRISNRFGITAELIGRPREKFKDYFEDFSYKFLDERE